LVRGFFGERDSRFTGEAGTISASNFFTRGSKYCLEQGGDHRVPSENGVVENQPLAFSKQGRSGDNPMTYYSTSSVYQQHCRAQVHSHLRARANVPRTLGFTLIELMIVVAIIAIILTLALPVYTNYSIRAKIGEALSVAAAAKTMVASTCLENPNLTGLDNSSAGYSFVTSTWVESITVSGNCSAPVITLLTRDTGAPSPAPELTLTANFIGGSGRITWVCASNNTPDYMLPTSCRSGS
jgi:type IV pilus assembly protein PilA